MPLRLNVYVVSLLNDSAENVAWMQFVPGDRGVHNHQIFRKHEVPDAA